MNKKRFAVAVLEGDGIVPEIVRDAEKILRVFESRSDAEFELLHSPF